jgi:hypothetical protein
MSSESPPLSGDKPPRKKRSDNLALRLVPYETLKRNVAYYSAGRIQSKMRISVEKPGFAKWI